MHVRNAEKLTVVVRELARKKRIMDESFEHELFIPYGIDRNRTHIDMAMARRLLDFSFTTRQGGQPKKAIREYTKGEAYIQMERAIGMLVAEKCNARDRYYAALATINSVRGIGQKIATMFIKFLVYHNDKFPEKKNLERELFIPIDVHVKRLLFRTREKGIGRRLGIYDEYADVGQQYATETDEDGELRIKDGDYRMMRGQRMIREDFHDLGVKEPPIILDYLWYVGNRYCRHKSLPGISCDICFLRRCCARG